MTLRRTRSKQLQGLSKTLFSFLALKISFLALTIGFLALKISFLALTIGFLALKISFLALTMLLGNTYLKFLTQTENPLVFAVFLRQRLVHDLSVFCHRVEYLGLVEMSCYAE